MIPARVFPLLREHDPDGTRLRTLPVLLDAGDSLLPATSLVPVDLVDEEIVGGDFTVEVVGIGLISPAPTGDLWGVNYKLHGGTSRLADTEAARIRLRPYPASLSGEPAYDQTYRVPIRHT